MSISEAINADVLRGPGSGERREARRKKMLEMWTTLEESPAARRHKIVFTLSAFPNFFCETVCENSCPRRIRKKLDEHFFQFRFFARSFFWGFALPFFSAQFFIFQIALCLTLNFVPGRFLYAE